MKLPLLPYSMKILLIQSLFFILYSSYLGLYSTSLFATENTYSTTSYRVSLHHSPSPKNSLIQLQGTLQIPEQKINGYAFNELSGLAWDEDEQLLYAINDKGILFHLRVFFSAHGDLQDIEIIRAYPINPIHKVHAYQDTEGLTLLKGHNGITGDSQLLVSFERQPHISRINTQGILLETYILPPELRFIKHYHSPNKALEAVAYHPQYGIITSPEWPLKKEKNIIIYSLQGKLWSLPRYPKKKSAVVALEVLADQSLLIMERVYNGIYKPLIISIRRFCLSQWKCAKHIPQPPFMQQIALFNSYKGWIVDNFEGLTAYNKQHFFIISDNNHSYLQKTLLTYFSIVPTIPVIK